jgi:3-hydroxyanthranilate 3,4-dioxygenase
MNSPSKIIPPLNLKNWIDENRHLLKPPVNNKVIYPHHDFIVMVVGGPNQRHDFHVNEGEEFFYQIEGTIELHLRPYGENPLIITLNPGDIFLLPPSTPHSPQRPASSVGLVIERKRRGDEIDIFEWYCPHCDLIVYSDSLHLTDIVTELPKVFAQFYSKPEAKLCPHCEKTYDFTIPKS